MTLFADDDGQKDTKIHVIPKNKPFPLSPPSPVEEKPTPTPASSPTSQTTHGHPPHSSEPAAITRELPQLPQAKPSPDREQMGSNTSISNNPTGQQPNLADQVIMRKLGFERTKEFLGHIQDGSCRGSPNCSTLFDQGIPSSGIDDVTHPSVGTPFFKGQAPALSHEYKTTSPSDAKNIIDKYGEIPGGVVLEGRAEDLGPIRDLTYDSRYNAFILDNRGVYLLKVRRDEVAMLCRALAGKDDNLGVSLSTHPTVYGQVPKDSDLIWDLLLADHFLGFSIAFGRKDWTNGYRFAQDYQPEEVRADKNLAVFFRFRDFEFQLREQEYQVTHEAFEARAIPLGDETDSSGRLLPDDAALASSDVPPVFERNVKHIADNIEYYRQERLVERVFSIGEAAAFIRGLKQAGVDLRALAEAIEAELATWDSGRKVQ
jgi:hypothetical protein